ncbi:unnamed protein product [Fraxinus pennsylvanica]|uniref:Protein kinase domain-containing protein n=1 Tax=Fraxinus pennsylvanica TaxID=56036 RepID=A0AAD2ABJ8_9LAMI|nr:unnamed protein product [Fraxinus pennsylvanica]
MNFWDLMALAEYTKDHWQMTQRLQLNAWTRIQIKGRSGVDACILLPSQRQPLSGHLNGKAEFVCSWMLQKACVVYVLLLEPREEQAPTATHVVGTLGYIAPELVKSGPTMASDFHSFGVVMLEVSCGRWSTEIQLDDTLGLVDWVKKLNEEGRIDEAVD